MKTHPRPDSYFYHVVNGRAYRAEASDTAETLKTKLREVYGDLRGVKVVRARSRGDALRRSINRQ